ncbi:hypothetical protein KUCAC02_002543 [Chaenocephalus aceratus]|uniref:Uncharacterized protein n=1 Tax=Chaenocephalus aceratus TaxID=36190 RepID=A0ACB9XV26_CHAAC|nr:hypothetical protein KUCAC02_002543 [Chaenocephalus aceratus]
MKKDIETLIAEERADIILKYATSELSHSARHRADSDLRPLAEVPLIVTCTEQNTVDPRRTLDPDFSIYKVIDRFGFMHEDELPAPTAHEEKRKQLEIERVEKEKWLKMVKKWDKYKNSDRMVKRVYKGVPLQLRGRAWALMLDVERQKKRTRGNTRCKMKAQALLCSAEIKQIDLDINRTFRNHVMFMDRFGVKQQALFSVLSAYSVYNTEVSYCQGMSQIAALLLMFLNEEDAFWALSQLLTHHTTRHARVFCPGFPQTAAVSDSSRSGHFQTPPQAEKHLDREQMSAGIYSTKWFLQCFIDRTPFTLTLRLWDIFILEGERLLTAMSYTILKIHKRKPEERPRLPLGLELPPPRGKTSAAGLSLNIIDSPDQSPSKDPRDLDPEQEEESRVIIHSQLPPDGSPLTGPPPYRPPEETPDKNTDPRSPSPADDSSLAAPRSCRIPRTLSAPVMHLGPPQSLSAEEERAEDRYLEQLLEQASNLPGNRNQNQDQDSKEASEETQDVS